MSLDLLTFDHSNTIPKAVSWEDSMSSHLAIPVVFTPSVCDVYQFFLLLDFVSAINPTKRHQLATTKYVSIQVAEWSLDTVMLLLSPSVMMTVPMLRPAPRSNVLHPYCLEMESSVD